VPVTNTTAYFTGASITKPKTSIYNVDTEVRLSRPHREGWLRLLEVVIEHRRRHRVWGDRRRRDWRRQSVQICVDVGGKIVEKDVGNLVVCDDEVVLVVVVIVGLQSMFKNFFSSSLSKRPNKLRFCTWQAFTT